MVLDEYPELVENIKWISEETTTGVHRLYEREKQGTLVLPAININDSVTKSKFDNKYGCRESCVDAIRRATDLMLAGKVGVVAGFGDVGKWSAESLKNANIACDRNGNRFLSMLYRQRWRDMKWKKWVMRLKEADVIVTATWCKDILTGEHFKTMKDKTVVCNIWHYLTMK